LHLEEQGAKYVGELVDASHAHRTDRVAMVGARQSKKSAARGTLVLLPILKGDLEGYLDCGGAIIAEEDAVETVWRDLDELGSKASTRLVSRSSK
jgi:hypothetical protein